MALMSSLFRLGVPGGRPFGFRLLPFLIRPVTGSRASSEVPAGASPWEELTGASEEAAAVDGSEAVAGWSGFEEPLPFPWFVESLLASMRPESTGKCA